MLGALIGNFVGLNYEHDPTFDIRLGKGIFNNDSILIFPLYEIMKDKLFDSGDLIINTFKRWNTKYKVSLNKEKLVSNISPIGWFANSEEDVINYSFLIGRANHLTEDETKWLQVVAMCVFYAKNGKSKKFIKDYIEGIYRLKFGCEGIDVYDNSISYAIYIFLISKDFEDCLIKAISTGKNPSMIASISCSIAEAYYKYIPRELVVDVLKKVPNKKVNYYTPKDLLCHYLDMRRTILLLPDYINNKTMVLVEEIGEYERKIARTYYSESLEVFAEHILIDYVFPRIMSESLYSTFNFDDNYLDIELIFEQIIKNNEGENSLDIDLIISESKNLLDATDIDKFNLSLSKIKKILNLNTIINLYNSVEDAILYLRNNYVLNKEKEKINELRKIYIN